MEYFFIVLFIVCCYFFFNRFPRFKQPSGIVSILFFTMIFYDTVFNAFTIWKLLAFLVLIGSIIYQMFNKKDANQAID